VIKVQCVLLCTAKLAGSKDAADKEKMRNQLLPMTNILLAGADKKRYRKSCYLADIESSTWSQLTQQQNRDP